MSMPLRGMVATPRSRAMGIERVEERETCFWMSWRCCEESEGLARSLRTWVMTQRA